MLRVLRPQLLAPPKAFSHSYKPCNNEAHCKSSHLCSLFREPNHLQSARPLFDRLPKDVAAKNGRLKVRNGHLGNSWTLLTSCPTTLSGSAESWASLSPTGGPSNLQQRVSRPPGGTLDLMSGLQPSGQWEVAPSLGWDCINHDQKHGLIILVVLSLKHLL